MPFVFEGVLIQSTKTT